MSLMILEMYLVSPIVLNYLKGYCNMDDCTFVFIRKIVQEKAIKLKEQQTSYEIEIHNI